MFEDEYAFQLPWLPSMKGAIGEALIRKATLREDRMQGTDLVLLEEIPGGLRIAVRIRRPDIMAQNSGYQYDITFTSRRETGGPNESQKIVFDTQADWFAYGHAPDLSPNGRGLAHVVIVDLPVIRPYLCERWDKVRELPNQDPVGLRCFFKPFSIYELVAHCGPTAIRLARPALSAGPFCECCWDPAEPESRVCARCLAWSHREHSFWRRHRDKKKR